MLFSHTYIDSIGCRRGSAAHFPIAKAAAIINTYFAFLDNSMEMYPLCAFA